ncbi:class I SAM-dependent methyltransferase [Corynebacterium sp.]|uniref:class I SAM-dependent methyltransferase n=1 Tax=Corynebacterium sp. TaxID=1720 RepID=UPI0026DC7988|nr:class I SAM-dependent methyltransferase [Corynebacterium sp.]MDO5031610.1 class I SAM-dependent methyltransferase [Corynebacterium sp.]
MNLPAESESAPGAAPNAGAGSGTGAAYPHLAAIDAQTWPGVATVPSSLFGRFKARRAEAEFAQACAKAGIELDPETKAETGADMEVLHDALFSRLAEAGWVGFAESYMAGEWITPDSQRLVSVLRRLLGVGYRPKAKALEPEDSSTGELPVELVRLYSGDGMTHSGGIFASGVPTTLRQAVPSYSPQAGRKEPKEHFVDVTTVSEPHGAERADLGDAQRRAAQWLLDATHTGAGTHLLVYPASGLRVAVEAVGRRATVDVLTADAEQSHLFEEQLVLEGVADSAHVQLIDSVIPHPKKWRGRYDAIVSVEKLELLSPGERKNFIALLDRSVASGGRVSLSSLVATEEMTPAARDAIQALRAYIWPGLDYPTLTEVHKLCDRNSTLRIVGQTHIGAHYLESLRQQRSFFEGHRREAAAAGFDPVFRRLWVFQFALREALLELGLIDAVQLVAAHRHRGGRR